MTQIAEKENTRALWEVSGRMRPEERILNKSLLSRAAVTMGFAKPEDLYIEGTEGRDSNNRKQKQTNPGVKKRTYFSKD